MRWIIIAAAAAIAGCIIVPRCEPTHRAEPFHAPLRQGCHPAADGCNTECCTGTVCTETLANCEERR